jgi:hypothetical protein
MIITLMHKYTTSEEKLLLTIALKNVDLPALGGPALATRTPTQTIHGHYGHLVDAPMLPVV